MCASKLRERIFRLIYSQNKTEEAILQLNRIIKTAPENSEAIALKAYALNKLANTRRLWEFTRQALESSDRALSLNPNDDIALTSKGWALIDLGKAKEALEVLQRATQVNPNNEYSWYNLAWAQYLTGNATISTESIARALRISPGNPIITRGKEMMEEGRTPDHLRQQIKKLE